MTGTSALLSVTLVRGQPPFPYLHALLASTGLHGVSGVVVLKNPVQQETESYENVIEFILKKLHLLSSWMEVNVQNIMYSKCEICSRKLATQIDSQRFHLN